MGILESDQAANEFIRSRTKLFNETMFREMLLPSFGPKMIEVSVERLIRSKEKQKENKNIASVG